MTDNDSFDESIESELVQLVAEVAGERLDKFAAAAVPDLSRSEVQRMIKSGDVLVNGVEEKASYRVVEGDVVEVTLQAENPDEVVAEDIPLVVLYEDADLAVIDKAAGMVVHPAYGNTSGTLVNALLHRWPDVRGVGPEGRSGIVHRLDKDTSGVIVIAKTADALGNLQRQFQERTVYKRYIALVEGVPQSSAGMIDVPIGRDPKQRKRMAVVQDGRESQTRYDVVEVFQDHALLRLELLTGRTHQIRVHLAWLGHPLVGDSIYGYRKQRIKMKRLFLHAAELHINSSSSGERIKVTSEVPVELSNVLEKFRQNL